MELKKKAIHYVTNRTARFSRAEKPENQPVLSEKALKIQNKLREYRAPKYFGEIISELLGEKISLTVREFHKSTLLILDGELMLTMQAGTSPSCVLIDGDKTSVPEDASYATPEQVEEFFNGIGDAFIQEHFGWLQDIEVSENA